MRRGFKAAAERLALATRAKLGLGPHEKLDPFRLAEHLHVDVLSLAELRSKAPNAVDHFLLDHPDEFSALTMSHGESRLIIFNPSHSVGRQANSVTHELSHILLRHEASPPLGVGGCRIWDAEQEGEADYLAGALLVPRAAAVRVAQKMHELAHAASRFGVSERLMCWRVYGTGAAAQAAREGGSR